MTVVVVDSLLSLLALSYLGLAVGGILSFGAFRRIFRDADRSPAWAWVSLVPVVGLVACLALLGNGRAAESEYRA